MEPANWNVVLVGAWNRAIFTPQWVAHSLFGLDEVTPITVEVPMVGGLPMRFTREGLRVVPSDDRVVVEVVNSTADDLKAGLELACRLLSELPKTPVRAAGYNIRYRDAVASAQLEQLVTIKADDDLAKDGYTVVMRRVSRAVSVSPGVLNVTIAASGDGGLIELNWHRDSTESADLASWLDPKHVDDRRAQAHHVVDALGLGQEVSHNG